MKHGLFIALFLFSTHCSLSQDYGGAFSALINEYSLSVNHGMKDQGKNFFGAGIEVNHVFKADQPLGTRVGLAVDFFHFWYDNESSPYSKYENRYNQHFYAANISIPFAGQINMGYNTKVLLEMGGQVGVNTYTHYTADIEKVNTNTASTWYHERSGIHLGPFFGINLGLGVRIPVYDQLSILLKPSVGFNVYLTKVPGTDFLVNNGYAKLTIGIALH